MITQASKIYSYLANVSLRLGNNLVPVFEGVVDNSSQQQSVSNLRRSSKGEHVNGSQGWVGLTQSTAPKRE